MRKYLSLIGVLLVLVVFHLMPNVEALVLESDELLFYVSRALLLGMNFDFGGGDGLESYPSLSVHGSSGVFFTGFMDAGEPLLPMVGVKVLSSTCPFSFLPNSKLNFHLSIRIYFPMLDDQTVVCILF